MATKPAKKSVAQPERIKLDLNPLTKELLAAIIRTPEALAHRSYDHNYELMNDICGLNGEARGLWPASARQDLNMLLGSLAAAATAYVPEQRLPDRRTWHEVSEVYPRFNNGIKEPLQIMIQNGTTLQTVEQAFLDIEAKAKSADIISGFRAQRDVPAPTQRYAAQHAPARNESGRIILNIKPSTRDLLIQTFALGWGTPPARKPMTVTLEKLCGLGEEPRGFASKTEAERELQYVLGSIAGAMGSGRLPDGRHGLYHQYGATNNSIKDALQLGRFSKAEMMDAFLDIEGEAIAAGILPNQQGSSMRRPGG